MSPPDPPTRWRVVRDVLGHRTEAEIDHGGRTELPDGSVPLERYQGTVGVALDRPGLTWPAGRPTTASSGRRRPSPPAPGSTSEGTPTPSRSGWSSRPAKLTSFAGPGPGTAASPATSAERRIDPSFSICP